MSKIGISSISINGEKFTPICSTKDIELSIEEEPPKWWQDVDFNKPITIEGTIRAKRKGTMLERSLYYQHSKKRRIRKKYDIYNLLGFRS